MIATLASALSRARRADRVHGPGLLPAPARRRARARLGAGPEHRRRPGSRLIGPAEVPHATASPPASSPTSGRCAGDASDNIPGVRGIGAKTAAAFLDGGLTLEDLPASGRLSGGKGAAITAAWQRADLAALPEAVISTGYPQQVYTTDTYNSLTLDGPHPEDDITLVLARVLPGQSFPSPPVPL